MQFRHKGKTEEMTEDITPASNIEEELSRVFSPRVGAQQPPRLCNPRVNYGSNGSSGKKGRLRSSSWKVKSAKEGTHSISLLVIDYGIAASSIRLTNSDHSYYVQTNYSGMSRPRDFGTTAAGD